MNLQLKGIKTRTITHLTPKKQMKGWDKGVTYEGCVTRMSNDRFGVFTMHYYRESGYRTYDSMDDIEHDFVLQYEETPVL